MLILVAEDNTANRELLREALSLKDYAIVEAADGEEALQVLMERSPDLVLLDIQMPKLDGYEVLHRIRADGGLSGTKVIALTALAMRGERERAMTAGFDGYVSKPITLSALYAEIERVRQQAGMKDHDTER
jgi:CheY-like chemotaxis protein